MAHSGKKKSETLPLLAGGTDVKAQPSDQDLVRRRWQEIVDAAVDLFSRKGFESTTVGEIAAAAGMSTGLIYHYARTKEDILLLVLRSVLDSYRCELPRAMAPYTDPLERLLAGVRAYCQIVDRRLPATLLAYRSTRSLPPHQRDQIKAAEVETNSLIEACIQDGIAKGLFRPGDVQLIAYHFVAFAHNWALKHWRLRTRVNLEGYMAQGLDVLIRGIATPAGWRRYGVLIAHREPGAIRQEGTSKVSKTASRPRSRSAA